MANQLYIYIYIFRGIWRFLSLLLQFKQIKSSGIEDRFMNAANLLLNWINIIQLPLMLVITKCTYDKHIEGDGGFWDLSQISDYKLKRFWDLSLYMYMKFFIIFTSTHSINKFRYRRRIHETSKSHIQRINIVQLALRLLITKWTFEKHIEGDGRFWDQSPMDSKLKTWYQAMRSTWEEIEGFETWVKSLTRNKKGSVKRNLKSEILARGEMTITS